MRKRFIARSMNRPTVRRRIVLVVEIPRIAFVPTTRSATFGLGLTSRDAIGLCIANQITLQHFLCLRSNVNHAFPAESLRLVSRWAVYPNVFASIYVARTKNADLNWTHARKSLQSHHIGHNLLQMGQGCLDN